METIKPSNTNISELENKYNQGYAIVLSSNWFVSASNPAFDPQNANGYLVKRHEYYVTNVDAANDIVDVRNPYGWSTSPDGYLYLQLSYSEIEDNFRNITMSPTTIP